MKQLYSSDFIKNSLPDDLLLLKEENGQAVLSSVRLKDYKATKHQSSAIKARDLLQREINETLKDESYELPKNTLLSVGELPKILQKIYQKAPNASGDEFTPKAPTEVVIQMAAALKAAKENADTRQSDFIDRKEKELFTDWMAHRLSIKEVENTLSELKKEADQNGLSSVASLAEKLTQEMIDTLEPAIKPAAPGENSEEALLKNSSEKETDSGNFPLLHNNMYGRLFESKVAEELMKNPPREVEKTMETIGKEFYSVIDDTFNSKIPASFINNLKAKIKEEPVTWRNKIPGLEGFLENNPSGFFNKIAKHLGLSRKASIKDQEILKKLMQGPVQSAEQAISIPYISVNAYLALRDELDKDIHLKIRIDENPMYPKFQWIDTADKNYLDFDSKKGYIHFERPDHSVNRLPSRLTPRNEKANQASGAGIGLQHHPAFIKDEQLVQGRRPAVFNMPDFDSTTGLHKKSMAQGIPFVSGISGATNIMMYLTNYLKGSRKMEIDPKNALLGTMMFLTYDGGALSA